jgi:hypothetical protein
MSANTVFKTLWLFLFCLIDATAHIMTVVGFNLFDSPNNDGKGGLRGQKKATELCICECKEKGLCPEKEELCVIECRNGNVPGNKQPSAKKPSAKKPSADKPSANKAKKPSANKPSAKEPSAMEPSRDIISDDPPISSSSSSPTAAPTATSRPQDDDDDFYETDYKWFVDFSLGTQGECVKSCVPSKGSFCGGIHAFWVDLYGTADECCRQRLWWMPQEQCVPARGEGSTSDPDSSSSSSSSSVDERRR